MKTFRSKLILFFLCYGFLIATISVGIIYNFSLKSLKTATIEKSINKYDFVNDFFNHEIESVVAQLNAIKNSTIFTDYIKNKEKNNFLNEYFISVVKSSKNIMQLRYINQYGQEKIRVDRTNYLADVKLIDNNDLQNKSKRYYFKKSMLLNHNDIWYSNLDLNMEQGEIEKPIKPVLRISTAVYHQNKKEGVLIINLFMKNILEKITDDSLYNISIIDKDGEYLSHPNLLYRWSRYLNREYKLRHAYPEEYGNILKSNFYEHENFIVKSLDFTNDDQLKIIIEPKRFFLHSQTTEHAQKLLFTLFVVVLLSFPLAYMFSRHPTRLKEQVDQFNATLENKIKSRTRRLHIANEKLNRLATLDFLTNIPNRRYFFTMGNKLFETTKRGKISLSMMILDIDYFKNVNDTYGHKIGDKVLKLVAKTIQESVRKEDIVARVGGEEFAILLNDTTLEITQKISEKIRSNIESSPFIKEDIHINLTASIGITQYSKEDKSLESIYDRADKALYLAKNTGRNCIKHL